MQTSREVRTDLVRALRLDLIGPDVAHFPDDAQYERERLPMRPSRWYLTGFLVPRDASEEDRSDETGVVAALVRRWLLRPSRPATRQRRRLG